MPPPSLPLSLLKGEICTQYIRCNKLGCRCQSGQPHGPYYYRVWREAGRVRKAYVRPEQLESVRASCGEYHKYRQQLRDLRRQRERLTRSIQGQWRKAQRFLAQSKHAGPAA